MMGGVIVTPIEIKKSGRESSCKDSMQTLDTIKPQIYDPELLWQKFSDVTFLAQGKFCDIFTADLFDKTVCLKVPKKNAENLVAAEKHVQKERDILKSLHHPNIIQIIGAGTDAKGSAISFVVLEFIEGQNLLKRLELATEMRIFYEKKAMPLKTRISLCIQLARALEYLHLRYDSEFSIIHRDLKPVNVAVNSQEGLKLLDFGLSIKIPKSITEHETFQMTGDTGTPRYMAPEIALRQQYNRKVDVYSFSLICWQVLTLQMPYDELTSQQFHHYVIGQSLRPKCDPIWPKKLSLMIESGWNAKQNLRPEFDEILSCLEECQELAPFKK